MLTINKYIIEAMVSAVVLANIVFGTEIRKPDFTDFYQSLETSSDEQAAQVGEKIFARIERKYRADAGFGALKSKIIAADFLANQMTGQLKKATGRQMFAVAGQLFENKGIKKNRDSLSVAPAKSFYETSLKIFKKPAGSAELEEAEKKFLAKFYDLKLRMLTSRIAKAGQALAIAEPSFKGTYDYVLVLPLLHASQIRPVNIDVLPKWMRQSSQLRVFSDSCLMHYGFAYHAKEFARQAAELDRKDFSPETFYRSASKKCTKQLPRVAVDCLKRAVDSIDEEKADERITLQFDIVQIWLDSNNFSLAAGEAKSIADNYSSHKKTGTAIWLHFYALSRTNNPDIILANIDTAINDPRCANYRAKLMYMKWWALRRVKDKEVPIAALEHQLIADYGNNLMVAPIILSQATDLLARQDYEGASVLLNQVQKKFPSTSAAKEAKKIGKKLKALTGSE